MSTEASPVHQAGYQLTDKPEEITHLVCCRDASWGKTFCGEPTDQEININIQQVCTMCVEAAEAMLPGCYAREDAVCPVDGNPCPSEHEIYLSIARATDPA
ncbi:hypothetical protein ACFQ1S_11465 [Kibdelosporangium lantanae]|uniref:4Fe-4S Wbl-type domain-containing protein n=1 Tax=Kibdelosporangium lantanae TaxID=1497396 RepID=A0ABW3M721_9PSEU